MYMKAEKAERLKKRSNAAANQQQEILRHQKAEVDDNEEHEVEGYQPNGKDFISVEMHSKMTSVQSLHDTNNNNNLAHSSV